MPTVNKIHSSINILSRRVYRENAENCTDVETVEADTGIRGSGGTFVVLEHDVGTPEQDASLHRATGHALTLDTFHRSLAAETLQYCKTICVSEFCKQNLNECKRTFVLKLQTEYMMYIYAK